MNDSPNNPPSPEVVAPHAQPTGSETPETTLPFVAEVSAAVTNILSAHPEGSTVTLSRLMDCAVGTAWLAEPEFTQFRQAIKKDPRLIRAGKGILQVMPGTEDSTAAENDTRSKRRVAEERRTLPAKPVQTLEEGDLAEFVDLAVTRLLDEKDQFGVGAVAKIVSRRVGFELSKAHKAKVREMIASRTDIEQDKDGIWRPKGGSIFSSERIVRADSLGEMISIWHREASANGAEKRKGYRRNRVHFKRGAVMDNWRPDVQSD